jgi:hypothetical protein
VDEQEPKHPTQELPVLPELPPTKEEREMEAAKKRLAEAKKRLRILVTQVSLIRHEAQRG